jgi:hypothetical protein
MGIDGFVTFDTAGWCRSVWLVGLMAVVAFGCLVCALEGKVCHVMIERFAIELDDFGVSAFVVGVALFAFSFGCVAVEAVEAASQSPVGFDGLVTAQAQTYLGLACHWLVALDAFGLDFRVPLDDGTRVDEPFKQGLRTRTVSTHHEGESSREYPCD